MNQIKETKNYKALPEKVLFRVAITLAWTLKMVLLIPIRREYIINNIKIIKVSKLPVKLELRFAKFDCTPVTVVLSPTNWKKNIKLLE